MAPFLGHRLLSDIVAVRGRDRINASRFLSEVHAVAQALPAARYVLNVCADRYRFAVGLAAAMLREQISLLPPAHTPELLRTLTPLYSGLYALSDTGPIDALDTRLDPVGA